LAFTHNLLYGAVCSSFPPQRIGGAFLLIRSIGRNDHGRRVGIFGSPGAARGAGANPSPDRQGTGEEQPERDLRHTGDTGGESTESNQRGDQGDD
jgi:hypothetical protein